MRGRSALSSQQGDADTNGGFGQKPVSQERAFDLRDPYKLNRAPLLRGGKRGTLTSYATVLLAAAALVGLGGVYREGAGAAGAAALGGL